MLLSKREINRLEQKIRAVETLTSAEFKIIVTQHAWLGLKRKARKLFARHKMNDTSLSNAILILLVEKDHQFLIYGDQGVHEKVGNSFWETVSESMSEFFKEGNIVEGLAVGLQLLADVLAEHYPRQENDVDELPNEIIFD